MVSPTTVKLIDRHLSELHRDLWAQRAAELATESRETEVSMRPAIQQKLDEHQANRHRPESSRASIEQAVDTIAARRGNLRQRYSFGR